MSKSIRISIAAIAVACLISCMVAIGEFGLSGLAFGGDDDQVEVTNAQELDKTVEYTGEAQLANVPETNQADASVTYSTSTDGGATWTGPQTAVPSLVEVGTLTIRAHIVYGGGWKSIDITYSLTCVVRFTLAVTTGSATKPYDGTPLTCDQYLATWGGRPVRSGDYLTATDQVDIKVTGSAMDVADGVVANTCEVTVLRGTQDVTSEYRTSIAVDEGTLQVCKNTDAIWVKTGSDSQVYDGTPLSNDDCTARWGWQEVSSGDTLCGSDVLVIETTGAITDAGWAKNECTIKVERDGVDVTDSYTISCLNDYGTLVVTPRHVTLTSASATRAYDGTPLTAEEVIAGGDGLVAGESPTYVFTGSRTDVGEASNCFYCEFGESINPNNYRFSVEWGSLEVTPRSVTLTSASATKVYDGTPLTNDEVVVGGDGFVEGEGVVTNAYGIQTNAGECPNTFTYWPTCHTDLRNYDITKETGMLEVTKRSVILTSAADSKVYDGTPLTNSEITVGGDGFVEGQGATYRVFGKRTNAGSTQNIFTYRLNPGTCEDNYQITKVKGDLTITPRPVTLTSGSATKVYDGTPLTNGMLEVGGDGFVAGQGICTYKTFGSQTDAGRTENGFEYELKTFTKAENYEITEVKGTLEVTPRPVTLTSATATKTYDGTPLTNSEVTVGGDGFVAGQGAAYEVTGTQTDVGESGNAFTYELNEGTQAGNYAITQTVGKLSVTPDPFVIRVETASASKVYDGTPLTKQEYTATWGESTVGADGALYNGDKLVVEVTGTITEVGTTPNTCTVKVMRDTTDVTAFYTLADTHKLGTLEVTEKADPVPTPTPQDDTNGTSVKSAVTGDSNILVLGILAVLALGAVIVALVALKKRRGGRK